MALGKKSEAIADLQEAALQPSDVKFMHLAWAQLENGDKAAARQSLETARKRGLKMPRLAPDDRARLAQLESALGTGADAASPQG